MLTGGVSYKGEPYLDDSGERRSKGGSLRDCGTSRQRANKDEQDRDDPESQDEDEASPIPQKE